MSIKKSITLGIILFMLTACSKSPVTEEQEMKVKTLDLSQYSAEKPKNPLHLLFIHHSCGGQLFADKGTASGDNCINPTHPNGGGLRSLLEDNNYIVHEASYGSLVGDKTDICHWNAKFRDHMDKILTCKHQDEFFIDGTKNSIVMFKSCFPNSWIESDGAEPGDPDSCDHTTANYKASYNALLEYFSQQPETLFVVVTAPPLAKPGQSVLGKMKQYVKVLLGRDNVTVEEAGLRIRKFNNWLKDVENGWLKDYSLNNIVVYDHYDALTGYGKSNWLVYPTGGGKDSHPSTEGNTKSAQEFIPFINKALTRLGL